MHSTRLQQNHDSCHRCGSHAMGSGRSGCEQDRLFGGMDFGGSRNGRRTFDRHHGHHGRGGARYGWGREGRIRFDDMPIPHRRHDSMAGLTGGLGDLNLGGSESGSGGGRLVGGSVHRGPFGPRPYTGSPRARRGMNAGLLVDPLETPYLRRELGSGMGSTHRLDMGQPYMSGEIGLLGPGGPRSPSLFSGSNYSIGHLDRRPRPYHYQPPYVEDYESVCDDDLLRQELIEQWGRSHDLMQGADLYGPLPFGYDIDDLRERRERL